MILFTSACTTQVYHPAKTEPEMRADIKLCSDEAHRKHWLDSVAALYHAYDCLDAKGYTRAQAIAGSKTAPVRAPAPAPAVVKTAPVEACRVPCSDPAWRKSPRRRSF